MKKLLLVSILLSINSLSFAGLSLDGPDTIEHGATVNMEINVDFPPTLDFAGTVWVNPATNNAIGDMLSNVILTPEDPFNPPEYPDLPDSFTFDLNYLPPYPTIVKLTFDLTNSGTPVGGTITIDLMDLTSGAVSTHNIEVVPEPASMLLFGLGAMMLRRGK